MGDGRTDRENNRIGGLARIINRLSSRASCPMPEPGESRSRGNEEADQYPW
jgi:hypothetical protein